MDPSGAHGTSTTATWSLKIGQPTVVGIAFDKLVGLRCHRARVRVKVPGHWITVRRHGKRVKVKTRARTKVERVMRCHPRTVRRRTVVFVRVRRHGHVVKVKRIKIVRVVVPPRVIARTSRVVAFGRGTTVNGYLGTASGIAIAGHAVSVLTAPDNGSNQFTQAAVVTTAANGTWTAKLPPGPSRIVEAVYDGDPTTEGASSGQVRVIVPAKVKLISVSPRRVAWGGTVRITGQLLGGYLPPGGALVRLRIGQGTQLSDLRCAGARHRQRALHDHLQVRRRVRGHLQELLVPDRDPADRRLCLRAGRVRTPVRSGRRAPASPGSWPTAPP